MSRFSSSIRIALIILSIAIVSCATPPPIPDADPRFDPSATDNIFPHSEYPLALLRLAEEGDVVIALLVLKDGSVGKVNVIKSSGYQRLDDAAVSWYSHHGKYLPGAKDGKTIAAWKTLKIGFKIKRDELGNPS